MSDNYPLQPIFEKLGSVATGFRTQFCRLFDQAIHSSPANPNPLVSLSSPRPNPINSNNGDSNLCQPHVLLVKDNAAQPVTKEELGRATWTFLHTLGAQYPEKPTRQQKKDVKELNNAAQPVTKEELGRATWTFLHTLGAQYPEKPTRQHEKDVKELMEILSRMYLCKECADHFKDVLRVFNRVNPVQAGSQAEFSQWLCHAHNVANRSLGKPIFPCERVDARSEMVIQTQHLGFILLSKFEVSS